MALRSRCCRYDTIRSVLMACVVLGHFLELTGEYEAFYRALYVFHMPGFVFLSGRLAKFRPDAVLRRLVVPYVVFQTLYTAFGRWVLGGSLEFQYTTPYWLLWYLPALACWSLLVPVLEAGGTRRMAAVLGGSLVLALAAGFDGTVGRYLSLSRIVVFFPYYAAGFYSGRVRVSVCPALRRLAEAAAFCGSVGLSWAALRLDLPREAYYHAVGYAYDGGGLFVRALLYGAGFCCVFVLFRLVPDGEIPVVTGWGRRTMPVFLLHGFLVQLVGKWGLLRFPGGGNFWLSVGLTLLVLAAFGRDWRAAARVRIRVEIKKAGPRAESRLT